MAFCCFSFSLLKQWWRLKAWRPIQLPVKRTFSPNSSRRRFVWKKHIDFGKFHTRFGEKICTTDKIIVFIFQLLSSPPCDVPLAMENELIKKAYEFPPRSNLRRSARLSKIAQQNVLEKAAPTHATIGEEDEQYNSNNSPEKEKEEEATNNGLVEKGAGDETAITTATSEEELVYRMGVKKLIENEAEKRRKKQRSSKRNTGSSSSMEGEQEKIIVPQPAWD